MLWLPTCSTVVTKMIRRNVGHRYRGSPLRNQAPFQRPNSEQKNATSQPANCAANANVTRKHHPGQLFPHQSLTIVKILKFIPTDIVTRRVMLVPQFLQLAGLGVQFDCKILCDVFDFTWLHAEYGPLATYRGCFRKVGAHLWRQPKSPCS